MTLESDVVAEVGVDLTLAALWISALQVCNGDEPTALCARLSDPAAVMEVLRLPVPVAAQRHERPPGNGRAASPYVCRSVVGL